MAISRAPAAEILCSGDELTLGRVVNSNAAWLSRRLSDLGFEVVRHTTLPDVMDPYIEEMRAASRRARVVILSGGLGPTVDDLTREAAARAFGKKLVRSGEALAEIRAFFAKRGRPMAPNNERQADFPKGSKVLRNPVGTAPGFALRAGRALVAALPGVPPELRAMFDREVAPMLEKQFPGRPAVATKELETIGLAESEVDRRLSGIATPDGNPRLSLMLRDGLVTARLVARGRTSAEARRVLAPAVKKARRILGAAAFGEDGQDISDVVVAMLQKRRLKLSVAESCTGGLIGHLLTKIPGVSAVLLEDIVTYANEAKVNRLGVTAAMIRREGAVSAAVAAAMAEGSQRKSGADVAVSVTGIAGPGGGTALKPVGLVYCAVRFRNETTVKELRLPGDRVMIQSRAARLALDQVRSALAGVP
ncbi:MAG: competence/damage-inducible protein A [Planctomycetes bacterium]|nr:competence/damage-inducible protein A [Planctomycetota bacterium]